MVDYCSSADISCNAKHLLMHWNMMSGEMGDGIISEKKISMTYLEIQEEWVCVDERRERYKGMVGDILYKLKIVEWCGSCI